MGQNLFCKPFQKMRAPLISGNAKAKGESFSSEVVTSIVLM